jgi:acyl-coenzyme A thioesterase PaaI-like protein
VRDGRPVVAVDVKLGTKLYGHGGIIHGGILALLFDEKIECACECLLWQQGGRDDSHPPAVTAHLNVGFHSPLKRGSEAVISVYHNESIGRKMYLSAEMVGRDGKVLFAGARSLFVLIRSSL